MILVGTAPQAPKNGAIAYCLMANRWMSPSSSWFFSSTNGHVLDIHGSRNAIDIAEFREFRSIGQRVRHHQDDRDGAQLAHSRGEP
jgi:hypothetical protein